MPAKGGGQDSNVFQKYVPWVWVGIVTMLLFYTWSKPPTFSGHVVSLFNLI